MEFWDYIESSGIPNKVLEFHPGFILGNHGVILLHPVVILGKQEENVLNVVKCLRYVEA